MRNLKEFPVTKDEIIGTLLGLAIKYETEERVGDIRPLLLKQAAQYVAYGEPPVNEIGLIFLDYINGDRVTAVNSLYPKQDQQ